MLIPESRQKKFGTATSKVEVRGIRYISLLLENLPEVDAILRSLCQLGGCYQRDLERMVVKQLSQKAGGSRPIMPFRTSLRVRSKASKV